MLPIPTAQQKDLSPCSLVIVILSAAKDLGLAFDASRERSSPNCAASQTKSLWNAGEKNIWLGSQKPRRQPLPLCRRQIFV